MSLSEPQLYPGERSLVAADVPLVVHERRGMPGQPLVVFLPGAIHTARVAYGHPGSSPDDFLAHWFEREGWSFAAVSYPVEVEQPVFEAVDANLGLAAYNRALATYISSLVDEWSLRSDVVVLGWSAAGNSAPGLCDALRLVGCELSLFVSLAATPPIPNLVAGSLEMTAQFFSEPEVLTPAGLLAHASLRSFEPELVATAARYGRDVLSREVYFGQYVANMPLNLFPGLDAQLIDGEIVVGHEGPLRESTGAEWSRYPMVAALAPTWRTDGRHAVTDAANWAMVVTNMLYARYVAGRDLDSLDDATWSRVTEVIAGAPDRLHRVIEGGHLFFLGRDGAQATVAATTTLVEISRELTELLGSLVEGS